MTGLRRVILDKVYNPPSYLGVTSFFLQSDLGKNPIQVFAWICLVSKKKGEYYIAKDLIGCWAFRHKTGDNLTDRRATPVGIYLLCFHLFSMIRAYKTQLNNQNHRVE